MAETTKDKPAGSGMVLTARDRQLITAVADFGVLTREQIARHLRFGSVTRVNAVLLRLSRHGYLERRPQPSLVGSRRLTYVLGRAGAELLGATNILPDRRRWQRASDLFLDHRLFVNDVRLTFAECDAAGYGMQRWLAENQLRDLHLGFIPDGYCEYRIGDKTFACFLEADNGTESRRRWQEKISAYTDLAFSGRFADRFARQFFRVLVITTSPRRADNIRRETANQTDRLFWFTSRSAFAERGPFAPIWSRPLPGAPQSLTDVSPP